MPSKNKIQNTCTPVALKSWDSLADKLSLTRSQFIETVVTSYTLQNGLKIDSADIASYWYGLPRSRYSNFTYDFINHNLNLSHDACVEALKFFYKLNLIKGIYISSVKQANIYYLNNEKEDEFVLYYAVNQLRGINIDQYISGKSLTVEEIGSKNCPNNEYIYLSKMQNINTTTVVSNYFSSICKHLEIEKPNNIDCLKVHYTSLMNIAEVLEKMFSLK